MTVKPEHAYQGKVRGRLNKQGALVFKIVERFRSGIPDLIVIHNGRTSFVELKVYPNELSALQELTMTNIAQKGGFAFVATLMKDGREDVQRITGNGDLVHSSWAEVLGL